jgi:hypothetical protein
LVIMDDRWIECMARELREAATAEARAEVLTRNELTEDQRRRLDALNLIEVIGLGDVAGAGGVTAWYESREEILALTAEVALVASRFVREVGKRSSGPELGGYL